MRKFRNFVWLGLLLGISATVVNCDGTRSVDGIALGMTRGQVEYILTGAADEARIYVSPVCTTFAFDKPDRSVEVSSWGQHPEDNLEKLALYREGVAYGHRFPIVGYDDTGKVEWVCGEVLKTGRRVSRTRIMPIPKMKDRFLLGTHTGKPRPGYCMGGPSAFLTDDGSLEIIVGVGSFEGRGKQHYILSKAHSS